MQPKLNHVFARYKFNNIIQNGDTSEKFVTNLKLHVKDCNYKDPEEMIRDRIVFGISSSKVRERLINEGEKLTLEKAIQISQSYEYSQEQLKFMSPPAEVHAVSKPWQKPKFPSGDNLTRAVPLKRRRHNNRNIFAKLAVTIVVMNTNQMCALLKEKSVMFVKNGIILLKFVIQNIVMFM